MDLIVNKYYQTALRFGLPVKVNPDVRGISIKLGRKNYYFAAGLTPFNVGAGNILANHKHLANHLLSEFGVPVPKALFVPRDDFKNGKVDFSMLSYPVVAKPNANTGGGTDVFCNIQNQAMLMQYLSEAFKQYKEIIIEKFHRDLKSYRVLVFYGQVLGVVERSPAKIIGDGVNSVRALV